MSDVHDILTRSHNMSQIKGKDTKPELLVRKYLFSKGFRYRLHDKKLPGKPDIILSKYKAIVFVNGCFWHGHNCEANKKPTSNVTFWDAKIQSNIDRDKRTIKQLQKAGWRVFTIWGCKLRNKKIFEKSMKILVQKINI